MPMLEVCRVEAACHQEMECRAICATLSWSGRVHDMVAISAKSFKMKVIGLLANNGFADYARGEMFGSGPLPRMNVADRRVRISLGKRIPPAFRGRRGPRRIGRSTGGHVAIFAHRFLSSGWRRIRAVTPDHANRLCPVMLEVGLWVSGAAGFLVHCLRRDSVPNYVAIRGAGSGSRTHQGG